MKLNQTTSILPSNVVGLALPTQYKALFRLIGFFPAAETFERDV